MRRWWRHRWRPILTGFLLAFLIGVICAQITKSFGDWNHGYAWERALMIRVHTPLPRALDELMLICPWFGTNISLIPAVAIICWWLWAKRHRPRLAMRLAIVQVGSYLLNPSLKALFDRARPDLFERRGWYGWSSYPSGHAIASVSVLLTLAIILRREMGWIWPYYIIVPILLASMYSRIYLAVHWPTDVIAGAVVGLVWLAISIWAFRDEPQPDQAI
ncbi:MAG: phosphatase PAP2 family protein [Gemmatimonadaceae bacterium]